ncbi:MAG: 2-phosphosulfolactate phosphatase [candidate division Zixibacteria bacterium]|nr:2-phosphosulfolactate phosphatase [candidate division Zixibacteria bacterium]
MNINLYLTPIPLGMIDLTDKIVVVIDVLRCTTSICAALTAGAKGVIPVAGPGEAGDMWAKIGSDNAVLAGERNGVKIENFQLGNSPSEFTPESVGGKYVVMTTTNGTAAFVMAGNRSTVLSCSLVNISQVAERVVREGRDVAIICAGQKGQFSIEDTICGGMLIHLSGAGQEKEISLNDAASLASLLYDRNKTDIKGTISQGEHGRFLASIGFAGDLETAASIDAIPVLPVMKEGRLVPDNN